MAAREAQAGISAPAHAGPIPNRPAKPQPGTPAEPMDLTALPAHAGPAAEQQQQHHNEEPPGAAGAGPMQVDLCGDDDEPQPEANGHAGAPSSSHFRGLSVFGSPGSARGAKAEAEGIGRVCLLTDPYNCMHAEPPAPPMLLEFRAGEASECPVCLQDLSADSHTGQVWSAPCIDSQTAQRHGAYQDIAVD